MDEQQPRGIVLFAHGIGSGRRALEQVTPLAGVWFCDHLTPIGQHR